MTNWTSADIRSEFLSFFKGQGHEVIPSASLVPHSDPTLMFTNAGMVPFKHVFSGAETLRTKKGEVVKRAASTQKCIRAGGKHNDLDNVGYTARHHTFFEMLGNFSFGDYFKEGAIENAWNLLTKAYALPKDKLYVTVYHTDEEAANLWKKIAGISDERIIRIATSDNFWAMGPTGPCGPCSEIFYDHGDKIWGGLPGSAEQDGDRFIEIWNLVFMQFEQLEGKDGAEGERIPLPKPCIDTGMGLERVSAVLEGVHDNYDIGLFKHLIASSKHLTKNSDPKMETSHRVIADHTRSCSFLLAEGVRPDNEGRGYVLRRIMRRAMRHAHMLGAKEPIMHRMVPALVEEMGKAFPELVDQQAVIEEQFYAEEMRFKETLGRGLKLLEEESGSLKPGGTLKGEVAFKLYDTYGFPLDLTQDILRAREITVDTDGFDAAMGEQKKRARAAWVGSGDASTEAQWFEYVEQFGATEFLGYQTLSASGKVLAILKDGKEVKSVKAGDNVLLLTNQTPFYGESGGQAGDKGTITSKNGLKATVNDTRKQLGKLIVHVVTITEGTLDATDVVDLAVDGERREQIKANHSATHILHAVLRRQLGSHVSQKGSLVEANYLRFDFSHDKAITPDELDAITREVNRIIRQNAAVKTEVMTPDAARAKGAMALFGEKYGDEVRVLSMGQAVDNEMPYSLELCGGTHVTRTGDIGLFRILRESSVSAGVRRIEALTGEAALAAASQDRSLLLNIADQLKATPQEASERITALYEEKKNLEREISKLRQQVAMGGGSAGGDESKTIAGVKFLAKKLDGVPAKDLRGLMDNFKQKLGSGVVVIISENEGKVALVAGVTDDLTAKISAVDIVRAGVEPLGGKGGGGRPDFAQGGGPDGTQADAAFSAIEKLLAA